MGEDGLDANGAAALDWLHWLNAHGGERTA